MKLSCKPSGLTLIVILFAGAIATVGIFSMPEGFAEKCKNNEDNNCNEDTIYQKSWTTNGCDLGNENYEHSKKSIDVNNTFACVNTVTNLENLAVIPDQFAEIR
jgi:hypothetical protein